jgi:hypothetical protein
LLEGAVVGRKFTHESRTGFSLSRVGCGFARLKPILLWRQ